MKSTAVRLAVLGSLVSACTANGNYNKVYSHADPVSGETTTTFSIELDNSHGSFLTAGSIGGKIDIQCGNNKIKRVIIDPTNGLANGWLDVKFDNEPHYEIQGTDIYPYDVQFMYPRDAKRFLGDVLVHDRAIMKVGTHRGYEVMVAHLASLPKEIIRRQCTSS